MICTKCGSFNPDGVKFCSNCGTPANQQPQNGGFGQIPPQNNGFNQPQNGGSGQIPPQNNGFNQQQTGGFGSPQPFGMQPIPKKNNAAKVVIPVIGSIFVIIICAILIFGLQTQQKAADKYAKGINTGNMNLVVEAVMPKKAANYIKREKNWSTGEIAEYYGSLPPDDMYISNVKVKVNGEYHGDDDELDDIKEYIEDELGIKVSDIEARYVEMSFNERGIPDSDTDEVIFYKSDGKWYIFMWW